MNGKGGSRKDARFAKRKKIKRRRQECRRGTHECVRHKRSKLNRHQPRGACSHAAGISMNDTLVGCRRRSAANARATFRKTAASALPAGRRCNPILWRRKRSRHPAHKRRSCAFPRLLHRAMDDSCPARFSLSDIASSRNSVRAGWVRCIAPTIWCYSRRSP